MTQHKNISRSTISLKKILTSLLLLAFFIVPASVFASNNSKVDVDVELPYERRIDYEDTTIRVYDITKTYEEFMKNHKLEDPQDALVELKSKVLHNGFNEYTYEKFNPKKDKINFTLERNRAYYIYDEKEYIQDFIITPLSMNSEEDTLKVSAKRGHFIPPKEKETPPDPVYTPEPGPEPESKKTPEPTPSVVKTPEPTPEKPEKTPTPVPTTVIRKPEKVKTGDKKGPKKRKGDKIMIFGVVSFAIGYTLWKKKNKKDNDNK